MPGIRQLHNSPCPVCQKDTFHVLTKCSVCGHVAELKTRIDDIVARLSHEGKLAVVRAHDQARRKGQYVENSRKAAARGRQEARSHGRRATGRERWKV